MCCINFHSLYDPNLENPQKALEKYKELKELEHEHGNKFSGKLSYYHAMSKKRSPVSLNSTVTLCLVMLELLVGQIQKEVMTEQKKMSWVPIKRDY